MRRHAISMWRFAGLLLLPFVALAQLQPSYAPGNDVVQTLAERGFNEELLRRAASSNNSSCTSACQLLGRVYPSNVIARNTTGYTTWQHAFWAAQQGEVDPFCIFQPPDELAVSSVVLVSRVSRCPFAVKSGGHAAFAGASSIEGGITIDLKNFKSVSVSADKSVVEIGSGNVWFDVYTALEPHNLTVIGGRVSDVGVGGLTLGGGISFFSNLQGWACDNVASYELIDADGNMLNVTKDSYPDLYWALRGGGNNFGIVTKFTMYAYPLGLMWGGPVTYLATEFPSIAEAFVNYAPASTLDPKSALTLVVASASGVWVSVAYLEYAETLPAATTHPAVFDELIAIPHLADQTGTKSLANITVEMQGGEALNGNRETYWTATFKLEDSEIITALYDIFVKHVEPLLTIVGLLPVCAFQPITEGILENMQKNGGNPLGLDPDEGPYFILNFSFMWQDPQDDETIFATAQAILDEAIEKGNALGVQTDYIYMNYASRYEDVIAGYGAESHARLKAVANKYDPHAVFQQLQPGYFKL